MLVVYYIPVERRRSYLFIYIILTLLNDLNMFDNGKSESCIVTNINTRLVYVRTYARIDDLKSKKYISFLEQSKTYFFLQFDVLLIIFSISAFNFSPQNPITFELRIDGVVIYEILRDDDDDDENMYLILFYYLKGLLEEHN
jgi:hypothetical protein